MTPFITKHSFLTANSCPTQVWYQRALPPIPLTPGDELRVLEGMEVGELARAQFPNGILVDEKDPVAAALRTTALMENPEVTVLFEASFLNVPFITRVDVLQRTETGSGLLEVKSARHKDEEVKADHIDDMAYTTMVLQKSGVTPESIELMRLSNDWVGRGGDPFKRINATLPVLEREKVFSEKASQLASIVLGADRPEPKILTRCKNCAFFARECLGKGIEYPNC